MLDLRQATMADEDWLLALRNDKLAREMSRNSDEVLPQMHHGWLTFRIDSPDHELLIALCDGVPIGMVRAEHMQSKPGSFEISINIAPASRRAGLGKATLAAACERWNKQILYASIKYNNIASLRVFGDCGFERIGSHGLWTQWRRLPRP